MGCSDYVRKLYEAKPGNDGAYVASCGLMTGMISSSRAVGMIGIYTLLQMALEYIKSNPDLIYQCARF